VISPSHSRPSSEWASAATVPRSSSSCSFVISRATTSGRAGHSPASSDNVAAIRVGASKSTTDSGVESTADSASARADPPRGRKPKKRNPPSARPDAAIAAVTADGPGMGVTRMSASTAARTSAAPGSLTEGMPASVTRATLSPPFSHSTTRAISSALACASSEVSGFFSTPRCVRSVRVRRVSSATIRATSRRVSAARRVMSSRLPMGVPTT
jgi:hypothetical protein